MKHKNSNGQEAIEFILITTLVFFGSLMVVLVFGNKIANFFTNDSSAIKAANASPTVIDVSDNQKYNPDYTTSDNNKTSYQTAAEAVAAAAAAATAAAAQQTSSGGTPYTINTDGSVSFSVAGQNVLLSSDIVQLQDIVMETSGSEGATSLVDEIAYMIQKHAAAYPAGDVPFEILFGDGVRSLDGSGIAYIGTAMVNSYAIKIGNEMVIIQKDQSCTTSCKYPGIYRIEGSINSSNKFNGTVTSSGTATTNTYPGGSYSGSINLTNGLKISNGVFYQNDTGKSGGNTYSWSLDFTSKASTT
ncbi:MAG: hypothetical protein AB1782_16170 [Cyanobacteriota bacterium]